MLGEVEGGKDRDVLLGHLEAGMTHLGMEQPKKPKSGSNTPLGTSLSFGMSPQLCGVAGGGRDPKLHLGTGRVTAQLC